MKKIPLGDGKVLLTNDRKMNAKEIKEFTGGGSIKLTPELAMDLARKAEETMNEFRAQVLLLMTSERAMWVRQLRCEHGYSWRAVAQACQTAWDGNWSPSNNQLMGMALCERAAEMFFENWCEGNWI